jgi:hypothetical protein
VWCELGGGSGLELKPLLGSIIEPFRAVRVGRWEWACLEALTWFYKGTFSRGASWAVGVG